MVSWSSDDHEEVHHVHDHCPTAAVQPPFESAAYIELFRSWMEQRGLAASTIDRRLSTVCGCYRFAHIDGRIASNPAQYVRRPQVHPSDSRGLDRSELGVGDLIDDEDDALAAALDA